MERERVFQMLKADGTLPDRHEEKLTNDAKNKRKSNKKTNK